MPDQAKVGRSCPPGTCQNWDAQRPALEVLTTGAVSFLRRRMWQVNVDTMAMVDAMGARAEFPL